MYRLSRDQQNQSFVCAECGGMVLPLTNGSFRNHCPFCLCSLHVDIAPGDRLSSCHGCMDAVALTKSKKGVQLVHHCRRCGVEQKNLVAEFTEQPDMIEPLSRLPWRH